MKRASSEVYDGLIQKKVKQEVEDSIDIKPDIEYLNKLTNKECSSTNTDVTPQISSMTNQSDYSWAGNDHSSRKEIPSIISHSDLILKRFLIIPSEFTGRVLGAKGWRFKEIQKSVPNASIRMFNTSPHEPGVMTLFGTHDQIESIRVEILSILSEWPPIYSNPNFLHYPIPSFTEMRVVRQVIDNLDVDSFISSYKDVEIIISEDEGLLYRSIILYGIGAIDEAINKLRDLIKNMKFDSSMSERVAVQYHKIGFLFGPRHSTINKIRLLSKATITPSTNQSNMLRYFDVEGTKEQIDKAVHMIKNAIGEPSEYGMNQKNSQSPNDSGIGSSRENSPRCNSFARLF